MNVGAPQAMLQLFSSPILLSAVWSLVLAQFMKLLVNLLSLRQRSFKEAMLTFLWKTGGMPSSHSALVVALATSIGITDGVDSSVFILAACFALVVIRDAMGVRRSAGLQARALNALSRRYAERFGETHSPIKEVMGHSPSQVLVGSLIGLSMAIGFCVL